jgi:hypothetical protein
MLARELVEAVGEHEESREIMNAADQVVERLQRCIVGPVDVLYGQHCGMPGPV